MKYKIGLESQEFQIFEKQRKEYGSGVEPNFCDYELIMLSGSDIGEKREPYFKQMRSKWESLFTSTKEKEDDPRVFLFAVCFSYKEIIDELFQCKFLDHETYDILTKAHLDGIVDPDSALDRLTNEADTEVDTIIEGYQEARFSKSEVVAKGYLQGKLGDIPDALLLKMTQKYNDFIEERKQKWPEEIENVKEEAMLRIRELLEAKGIKIDEKQFQRMANTQVILVDPLVCKMEENWGTFDLKSNLITLRADLKPEPLLHTLVHEYLHALSGITLRVSKQEDDYVGEAGEDEYYEPDVDEGSLDYLEKKFLDIRLGLNVANSKEKKNDLSWLNEGVVEYLTSQIEGKDTGIYRHERDVLNYLLKKVPEHLFLKALFEDYNRNLPQPQRLAHIRTLIREVNKAFGDFFLQWLDRYIAAYGIENAAQKAKTNELEKAVTGFATKTKLESLFI